MGSSSRTDLVQGRRRSYRLVLAAATFVCGMVVLAGPFGSTPAAAVNPSSVATGVSVSRSPAVSELRTAVAQDDDSYVPTTLPPSPTFAPTTTVPADVAGETTVPRRPSGGGGNLARTGGSLALLVTGSLLAVVGIFLTMVGRRPVGLR